MFQSLFQKYAPSIDSNQVLSKDELLKLVLPEDKWMFLHLPFTLVRKVGSVVKWE